MKSNLLIILLLLIFSINSSYSQDKPQMEGPEFDLPWSLMRINVPLFINGNVPKKDMGDKVMFSCIITPFSPALNSLIGYKEGWRNKVDGRSYGYVSNLSVKQIFQHLHGKDTSWDKITNLRYTPEKVPDSRTMFRDIDTSGFVFFLKGIYRRQNLYTIQLTSSTNITEKEIKKQMINAMQLQFGLSSQFEKQVKKCMVILRNGLPIPEYSEGKIQIRIGNIKETGKAVVGFNNITMGKFVDRLETYFYSSGYPIIDETGFNKQLGLISFDINEPKITFENLGKHLANYGMKLTLEEREVDVLVISKSI